MQCRRFTYESIGQNPHAGTYHVVLLYIIPHLNYVRPFSIANINSADPSGIFGDLALSFYLAEKIEEQRINCGYTTLWYDQISLYQS